MVAVIPDTPEEIVIQVERAKFIRKLVSGVIRDEQRQADSVAEGEEKEQAHWTASMKAPLTVKEYPAVCDSSRIQYT